jgi:2-polyprenyl-3-methyl-5-hydroxy-6-metoxy-1,4-benzoquinol methylase
MDYGAVIDQDVINRHTAAEAMALVACQTCGLQYFSPAVPGDAEFYRLLTTTADAYYSEDKWDFQATLELVAPGAEILDIACGGGAWLQRARAQGAKVCGIDTNPAAVASARSAGLPAHCQSLAEFAREHGDRFDIVTAFQVVEHLSEVLPFIEAASACLKPGGRLIVTVPNRLRCVRSPFEPLDCPPHHMSRWSAHQLSYLARLTGLNLRTVRYETASMSECRAWLRNRIAPAGRSESLWARAIGRFAFAPSLYTLYHRIGLLDYWRLWRMSMMAVFERSV